MQVPYRLCGVLWRVGRIRSRSAPSLHGGLLDLPRVDIDVGAHLNWYLAAGHAGYQTGNHLRHRITDLARHQGAGLLWNLTCHLK